MSKNQIKADPLTLDKLLPHGADFVLLDSIENYGEDSIVCRLSVNSNKAIGISSLDVSHLVGIEYMAQSAAALGALRVKECNLDPQPGVVLSIKQLHSTVENFTEGQSLLVYAKLTYCQDPMRIFQCEIKEAEGHKLLMSGEISIFVQSRRRMNFSLG